MRTKYARALILLVFVISFLPFQTASADLGPKPTMSFTFTQEFPGAEVTIVSGKLLECKQSDCSDAKPLMQAGPQGFGCEATTCHALAYGFSDYHRVEIEFSDGKTRQSNIFKTAEFDSIYKVTIRPDDLLVESQIYPTDYAPYLLTLLIGVIITLPTTIFIEGIIVFGFTIWKKKPTGHILAASVLANLLTQSMLWGALKLYPHANLLTLFTIEFFIWLIESAILRYFPATRLTWREALILSFGMNLASFWIGWFLPV